LCLGGINLHKIIYTASFTRILINLGGFVMRIRQIYEDAINEVLKQESSNEAYIDRRNDNVIILSSSLSTEEKRTAVSEYLDEYYNDTDEALIDRILSEPIQVLQYYK
jgi:flagellar hook-associated protein FlgK